MIRTTLPLTRSTPSPRTQLSRVAPCSPVTPSPPRQLHRASALPRLHLLSSPLPQLHLSLLSPHCSRRLSHISLSRDVLLPHPATPLLRSNSLSSDAPSRDSSLSRNSLSRNAPSRGAPSATPSISLFSATPSLLRPAVPALLCSLRAGTLSPFCSNKGSPFSFLLGRLVIQILSTGIPDFLEVVGLFFRGQHIFLAAMEKLMSIGMRYANQAILTGCSAGGLATIHHCDGFQALFPESTRVKCLADA